MNPSCEILDSKVAAIMTPSPIYVEMQDSMEKVNTVLSQHGLTSVPVVDPQKQDCFGIVSLKDVSNLKARKIGLQTVRAWEACTYKPVTVSPDTSVADVLKLMVQSRSHHVIITENHKLKGFVSTFDVIAACMARKNNACSLCATGATEQQDEPAALGAD